MAARRVVLCPDPAAVRLREAAGDRQTEAGPELARAAASEGLEERVPFLGGQTRPAVDDV